MKKSFFYAVAALVALLFAGCEDAGVGVLNLSTPDDGRTRPTVEGLELKTLSVYYTEDETSGNLVRLRNGVGDYYVPDADNERTITVFAEAKDAERTINITWQLSDQEGRIAAPGSGSASLGGIPVPTAVTGEGQDYSDTLVTITVSDGNKSYPYTVALQAPGMNSSLASLWMIYGESGRPEANYYLWTGDAASDKDKINFFRAQYNYTVELKNKAKAETPILISARAASAYSEIELKMDGVEVAAIEPPESSIRKNSFFANVDELVTGGAEDGLPIEDDPSEEEGEGEAKYYKITIPEAGSDAIHLVFKVTSSRKISSTYTITIVPPQKDGENTGNGRLSNLEMQYIPSNTLALTDFTPDETAYAMYGIPKEERAVKITSLVPAYVVDSVEISYIDSANPNTVETIAYSSSNHSFKEREIPLPGPDETLTIKIKVGNAMNNVEYSVVFRNPSSTKNWAGTAQLGTGIAGYTITEIKALTEDGESHDTLIEDLSASPMKW
ncbi:MAG: hypothetical protein LBH18_04015 [Spirochaetaceae bacterium]|jgi:hypothetical protein|nr:hypothetical protein [Spirochaetaceae bacterium]